MSEKHFGESEEMEKADEQMTEKELEALLEEGILEVTNEELEAARKGVEERMDEENPER